ncbi:MAG: hypothetical protein IPQ19_09205 [Bacteroidetes bacterium]|nr:hypothetical protein [Bacteroidota bacterium]
MNQIFVLVGNTCIVISILLKNKIASSKDFETIKEILFCYYDTKIHNNDVVHRFATKCLIEILDKEEIKRLVNFYSTISKTVSDGIANGVFNKFPNEIFAINLLYQTLNFQKHN